MEGENGPMVEEGTEPKVNGGEKVQGLFEMTLNPPDWLNKDYMEKALRDYEGDQTLIVTECSITPATKPGDNFASIVFRAVLTYVSKKYPAPGENFSYIMKVKPFMAGLKKDLMANLPFFETEIDMYTKVFPEMQRLLSQIGETEPIAPTLIHHSLNPDIVIFEDISKYGYVMRYKGLDYEGALKVITKLATFHSLSYYIQNESILDLTDFTNGLFSSNTGFQMDFIPQSFHGFADAVKDYGGYEVAVEKLEAIKPLLLKKMGEIYKPRGNPYGVNVLNHGDFHIRNLLFINNGDDIDKLTFIDFQICFWGTPAIDLYYLLYAISSEEPRDRVPELIRAYHEKFCSILTDLGYLKKPPSLLELHIELLRHGFMETIMMSCFLPMFFMDMSQLAEEMKDAAGDNMEALAQFQKKLYRLEGYKKNVDKILPRLLYTGQLEV
ncbi:uncharacterized protein DMENIID0001_032530 [Sergentomyia squamirostris]